MKGAAVAVVLFLAACASAPSPIAQTSKLAAVDSHGVWFDGSYGNESGTVWLYAAGSLQAVATVGVSYFAVAGGCIP